VHVKGKREARGEGRKREGGRREESSLGHGDELRTLVLRLRVESEELLGVLDGGKLAEDGVLQQGAKAVN